MHRPQRGLTFIEIFTLLVALVVIVAVAIPLWNTRQLRAQRAVVMQALFAVQAAEDRHFGKHARYARLEQLGIEPETAVVLAVELAADELGYVARAHVDTLPGVVVDARCAQMRIDQHGRPSASTAGGEDSTGDCWDRK